VNSTWELAPWADVVFAVDCEWWRVNAARVNRRATGELWTTSDMARDEFGLYWCQGIDQGAGLSRSADHIHIGRNSGYAAISLAYLFGADRLTLIGYDMQRTGGRHHWHADHPAPLRNATHLENWCSLFRQLAVDLEHAGVQVTNCTTETALTCFPRARLEDVFP
jgi:hypothetical protein